MKNSLTILCLLAVAGGIQAEDLNVRGRGKAQAAKAAVAQPATNTGGHSFHPTTLNSNATLKSNNVQSLNAQRNWSKTQLNSTSSVNTARFHKNGVTQSQTFNPTTNSARWQKNNNARVTNTTNVNGAKWQKFNNNTNVTVNNNSNNRFRRFNNLTVNSNIPRVTFHQGNRINAARNWNGVQYSAFRNYQASWHDRDWWRGHNSRIIFALGGWYYWNDGFWCPAYGYDRSSVYYWDGPIYGYNDLPPDQVVANVQSSLQAQGYYQGAIDGILGPQTRAAVASYQQDHGLLVTSAIDQPTVEALGFS